MISYSKRYVNIISIFVTIIIFVLINNINIEFNPQSILKMFKKNIIQVEINTNNINQNTNENKKIEKEIQNNYPEQKKQIVTKEEEIKDTKKLVHAKYVVEVNAPKAGYISCIQAEEAGMAALMLGAGRETKESTLDYSAGFRLLKKTGDKAAKGEAIALLYANVEEKILPARQRFLDAVSFSAEPVLREPLIKHVIQE